MLAGNGAALGDATTAAACAMLVDLERGRVRIAGKEACCIMFSYRRSV